MKILLSLISDGKKSHSRIDATLLNMANDLPKWVHQFIHLPPVCVSTPLPTPVVKVFKSHYPSMKY